MKLVTRTIGRNEFGYILDKRTAIRHFDGGISSLMLIREVEKPLDIRNPVEKIRILDKGYSWLQIAIDKEYYWLSAIMASLSASISI